MPNRRAFIMTMLGAASACTVFQVTSRLGKKTSQPALLKPAAPVQSTAAPSRPTSPPPVVLIPRSAWGAVEPSVSPDGFGEHGPYNAVSNPSGWLVYDQPLENLLDRFIIHHSALPLSDGPREIQRLHMEEKNFADIGYHFLVDEKGHLYEGRSLKVRGAHTYGANYGSLGICLLGNFEEIQPTTVQLSTLKTILTSLIASYSLLTRLAGHRDYNPGVTLCPGANLYALLPDLCKEMGLQYGV